MKKYTKKEIDEILSPLYEFTDETGFNDDTDEYIGSCITDDFYDALGKALSILEEVKEISD